MPQLLGEGEALLITGHSLGGALAALAANDLGLAMRVGALRRERLKLYTFGKPVVGASTFGEPARTQNSGCPP